MNIYLIIFPVIAYLLGSVPTAVWIGRAFFDKDVRDHGSGNAGATNTIRVLGWKAGSIVMVVDIMKGWLAVSLPIIFEIPGLDENQMTYFRIILGACAVAGHIFPVFAGFRGGKGVATLLGIGIALYPISVWMVVVIFFIVLFITGYVSLGSVIASISFPILDILIMHQQQTGLIILSVLIGIMVPYTHRNNIRRLLKGEESKFIGKDRKNKNKQL